MSAAVTARPTNKQALAREPRVQLLPPSVRERERARASMRLGVLVVVLGVVASAALVGYGYLRQTTTAAALEQANARTSELFAQRAQYAEATQVATTIEQVLETQRSMTSYEIDLSELLGLLRGRLGDGMSIRQLGVTVQAPWGVPLTGEDVLAPPRIAVVELTVASSTIAQATAYREALAGIPGYAGAVLLSTSVGTDGAVTTQMSLALATDAVSGRFATEAADETATGETEED